MASTPAAVAMELKHTEGGQQEGATIVESSPNPFSKAVAAAQRLKNKKRLFATSKPFHRGG